MKTIEEVRESLKNSREALEQLEELDWEKITPVNALGNILQNIDKLKTKINTLEWVLDEAL